MECPGECPEECLDALFEDVQSKFLMEQLNLTSDEFLSMIMVNRKTFIKYFEKEITLEDVRDRIEASEFLPGFF